MCSLIWMLILFFCIYLCLWIVGLYTRYSFFFCFSCLVLCMLYAAMYCKYTVNYTVCNRNDVHPTLYSSGSSKKRSRWPMEREFLTNRTYKGRVCSAINASSTLRYLPNCQYKNIDRAFWKNYLNKLINNVSKKKRSFDFSRFMHF